MGKKSVKKYLYDVQQSVDLPKLKQQVDALMAEQTQL